jgi:HlyD family secretion protein
MDAKVRRTLPRTPLAIGLALAGLLAIGGSGCDVLATAPAPTPTAAPKATPTPQRATVTVRRGTIVDAIKVLGRVVSSQEADLSFRNSGRIREVYVQVGDLVQTGQVLAELDQRTLPWDLARSRNLLEQAQIRLAAAQARQVIDDSVLDQLGIRAAEIGLAQAQVVLDRLQAGPQEQDVKKVEAEVASARAALDRARFDLQDKQAQLEVKRADLAARQQGPDPLVVAQVRAELEAAKVKLAQAQAGPRPEDVKAAEIALDQERTKLQKLRDQPKVRPEDLENARLDVQKAQANLAQVLADIDAGRIRGQAARDAAVQAAQNQLQQAQNTYDKMRAASTATDAEIRQQEQAVTLAELALAKLKNPQTYDVEAAKAAVNAAQAKLDQLLAGPTEAELASLQAQIQALELGMENARQAVSTAEASLAAAEARRDLVLRGASEFDLQDARNRVSLARNAIESAQAKLKAKQETIAQSRAVAAFDLETLRRAVEQARLDVQNFEAQTGDVKIIAPFDGRITRLAARPGDTVQAFFPILNLSSLKGLEIKADISEGDLQRIAPGMPVEITMDAYPNQVLSGRIAALPQQVVGQVGQAPDRATRISVDWPGPGAEMGMLARVQITLQVKDNVLIVPNGAVRTVGRRRFVEYMDGEIKRSRNVEVGIVTDQETEIVSGLTEGMVILAGQS